LGGSIPHDCKMQELEQAYGYTFWAILFPMTAKYAGKSANHVIRMENKDKVLYNRISAAAPLLFLIKHEICRVGITLCIRPEVMYV